MNAVSRYLKSLLLLELWQGLGVTLRYYFRPKFTINYPEEKTPKSNRFRGGLRLVQLFLLTLLCGSSSVAAQGLWVFNAALARRVGRRWWQC